MAGTGSHSETGDNNTSVLNGRTSAVTNAGLINVRDNNDLTLQGTIDNTGEIDLNTVGNQTQLIVDVTGVILTGAGDITLDNNGNNAIDGVTSTSKLTNINNTISGAGQIGDGQLTLVNSLKGVIDGNLSTNLVLNTGANTITNAGLIESDAGGGTVIIDSAGWPIPA